MRIVKEKEVQETQWNQLVAENGHASPFQSPAFYQFFNSLSGLSASIYGVEQERRLLATCLVTFQKERGLKGYFSRRAIIYGGPLCDSDQPKVAEFLIKAISKDLKSRAIYIETRNFSDYSSLKPVFVSAGWEYEDYLNYHLECGTQEKAMAGLNSNRKRQIKKARQNGAVIAEAASERDVLNYYSILESLYKTRIKKPLFEAEFFLQFYRQKLGPILLVKYGDKIIGGIVCPVLKDRTIYEYYICGLDDDYRDLSPSVMATYAAIEYGFTHGLQRFDFMGAGRANEDYGVRDFKSKFGGELVEHGRFIKINNQLLFLTGRLALSLLKKIKK